MKYKLDIPSEAIHALNAKRAYFWHIFKHSTDRELYTYLGFANYLVYIVAENSNCIKKVKVGDKNEYEITGKPEDLVLQGVHASTSGLCTYLKKYWPKAVYRKEDLLSYRDSFRNMELLDWEPRKFSDGKREATVYHNVMIADILIMVEVIEEIIHTRENEASRYIAGADLSSFLPKHKGFAMVKMFNWVFQGVAYWRRKTDVWNMVFPVFDIGELALQKFNECFQRNAVVVA